MPHTIFVTAATGTQGRHVVHSLLAAGHTVHALVRKPASPSCAALQSLQHDAGGKLKIFQGDFSSIPDMAVAARGCTHAFINVSPVFGDPGGEARHGRNVVDACRAAGSVKHIVLSSVPHLDRIAGLIEAGEKNATLRYRGSKFAVEKSVVNGGFENWTVLKVSRLLSSFVDPLAGYVFPRLRGEGVIRTGLTNGLEQSVVDPRDVGRVVARIVDDGDGDGGRYRNKKVALEGGRVTFEEIVGVMNEVLGEEGCVRLQHMGEEELRELARGGNLIVAGEMLFNENPEMLVVDENDNVGDFGFGMGSVKGYFMREKEALKRAVGRV